MFLGNQANGYLAFQSNATERMRIDSSGSVAIGSTSTASATRLTLKGAGTGSNTLFNCQDSGGNALLTLTENGVVNLPFAVSGDAHLKIQQGSVTTLGAVASSGVSIGGGGSNNHLCQIGLGYSGTYQPTAISSITTTQTGNTSADLIFATRSVTTDTAPSERMRIEAGGNINMNSVVYGNTTVNAANMFLNSGPTYQIYRSTSSIRYKKDVETIENSYSEALLQCRPVWFRSSCSGDNKDYGYWGFIAEEVAEIDPRLVFLTTTETIQNEDGESVTVQLDKPRVDGVQYDRFVPHLLNLIKKQNETLTQQAETINALTARIVALESK
jgi:hypothetical protein